MVPRSSLADTDSVGWSTPLRTVLDMPRTRVVLQSRKSSARLPGKCFLDVGGRPLTELCVLRLANRGADVVVATSDDPSDDVLAETLGQAGLRVVRGPLDDVHARFLLATLDLRSNDIVVRATADNPVPDGALVDWLVGRFSALNCRYLSTTEIGNGLPYGLSLECFRVETLRAPPPGGWTPLDREHVTTSMRSDPGARVVTRGELLSEDCSTMKCTIDTQDDYLNTRGLFHSREEAVTVHWRSLVRRLQNAHSSVAELPLTLGTAQFGMRYGAANATGELGDAASHYILMEAMKHGIRQFDTALGYGSAEARLGRALAAAGGQCKVTTKVPGAPRDALSETGADVRARVRSSVLESQTALGRRELDRVLLHDYRDLSAAGGIAVATLAELSALGTAGSIGVSVYSPSEALLALQDPRLSTLQLPFNTLDRRWLSAEFQFAMQARPDVWVQARSVFLQGLLLCPDAWPPWARKYSKVIQEIARASRKLGRTDPLDACLAYVRSHVWVNSPVVGVDCIEQLRVMIDAAHRPPMTVDEAAWFCGQISAVEERVLDPRRWN